MAPLDIPQNSSLGAGISEKHWDDYEFIDYVWSTSTTYLVEEMKGFGLSSPKLSRSALFRHLLLSKRFTVLEVDKLKLPEAHFDVKSGILVPVVVNKQSVALLGLANGQYNNQDAEIIFEVIPKMWTNVIVESVSKATRKIEDTERLQAIENRVEEGKKMSFALSQILKGDDADLSLTKTKLLKKKLYDIANYLEERYGGICFIAPIRVTMNLALLKTSVNTSQSDSASENELEYKKGDEERFMSYVFSKTANSIRKTSMKGTAKPKLENARIMLEVVRSKKAQYYPDCTNLKLPSNHFPMTTALLVPICINDETVALVGLANGKISQFDGDILADVLSTSWFSIIQGCLSDLEKEKGEKSKTVKSTPKIVQNDDTTKYEKASIVVIQLETVNQMIQNVKEQNLIDFVNYIYGKLDFLCGQFGLRKISTSSNIYIAGAGLTKSLNSHEVSALNFCLGFIDELAIINKIADFSDDIKATFPIKVKMTIGTGSVVGGLFEQEEKQFYNVFGEAVELARELQTKVQTNEILIAENTYEVVKQRYDIEQRNDISFLETTLKTFAVKSKKQFFSLEK